MAKLILPLLLIVIATTSALAKTIPGNELKYIGSFRQRSVQGGETQYEDYNYYISQNAGAWNSANTDCKRLLGDDATLLAIESQEEWQFVIDLLVEDGGFATKFWTSGLYDSNARFWRWYANNVQLPPFAPWGTGCPTVANTLQRVMINYASPFDVFWCTESNTNLLRYICEVQVPTIALPCYHTNDLAIVLDSSGSIGADNFQTAISFVERLANAFTVYSASRISFVTFSSSVTTRIALTNGLTRAQISSAILQTAWEAGTTATDLGIEAGMAQLVSNARAVPMNMVVLTDGQSNSPSATLQAAQAAIGAGIRTFSVGITPSINQQELLGIAGNDINRVFTSANFDQLINLLAPLSMKVCPS